MSELPAGTSWAYGTHMGTNHFWDAPEELCGVDGCVFLGRHRGRDHSWANELTRIPGRYEYRRRVVKVRTQFRIVFNVTREVEIDEEDFNRWALGRYGAGFDRELACTVWIDGMDTDRMAAIFHDFRTNEPLPSDFEFQYSEAEDVTISTPSDSGRGDS